MRKYIHPVGKRTSLIISVLFICIAANFLVTWIAGSKLESLDVNNSSPAVSALRHQQEPPEKKKKPKIMRRKTMPPQESSQSTAGFIHIGKTGGSTISKLLRHGCTSFVAGPCRNVTKESIVSKKVVSYHYDKKWTMARRYIPQFGTTCFFLFAHLLVFRNIIITFQTFIGCPLQVMDRSSFLSEMSSNEQFPPSCIIIQKMLL